MLCSVMTSLPQRTVVVGVTGASGAACALRVIELLATAGTEIHLVVTAMGRRLLREEAEIRTLDGAILVGDRYPLLHIHPPGDMGAVVASGSFLHDGMIIVPASSNTMGCIAAGITSNLVHRAALVSLKEGRPLVIAHRESPTGRIDLQNMLRLDEAGAIIAPLNAGFYMHPETIDDLVDFMAGRLLDLLGIPHGLDLRWNPEPGQRLNAPG